MTWLFAKRRLLKEPESALAAADDDVADEVMKPLRRCSPSSVCKCLHAALDLVSLILEGFYILTSAFLLEIFSLSKLNSFVLIRMTRRTSAKTCSLRSAPWIARS